MRNAINPAVYAVGKSTSRGGFIVREVVFSRAQADSVAHEGEEIREAAIMVAPRRIER
jgi:hypothetical protein